MELSALADLPGRNDRAGEPRSVDRLIWEGIDVSDKLSVEERDVLERFERSELRSAADAEKEIEAARLATRQTFGKTRRVNLKLCPK